ncbi:MAG: TolC family outer membrane protein [Pseudomonadota bacterium]|nr:TolC family outer membrane protein [Pseudomonadota bacterium]
MGDDKRKSARERTWACGAGVIALALATVSAANAETIGGALIKSYLNNPDINAQRAAVRASDEGVPGANAGYLPTVTANANAGVSSAFNQDSSFGLPANMTTLPRGYGVTVQENLFNGNKTYNSVRKAESTVLGAREQLRYTEQNTLLTALTNYMNVMRDAATLDLNRSNVDVLKEQLRQTKDRFNVGEVTRTDVAQAEAALAQAQSGYLTSQSTLQASIANYRQVIGDEPHSLAPVTPVSRLLPSTLTQAIAISQVEHPAITAYLHGVDVALLNVKISEAALYPSVNLQGSLTKSFDPQGFLGGAKILSGSLVGQINIPIYDGGASFASIRQAKEQLSQQELTADSQRDKVRASVVAAWGANQNALGVLRAAKAQVQAAEVALAGVREEAKVGQRTTFDVLTAQQTLLQARTALVNAQHDQVVDSYTLLSNIGRLSVKALGLSVAEYDPRVHFDKVKSKQFGVRTPDGR